MSLSFPVGSIPPSSIRDLGPPIITFVGRPAAWDKGLDILLDALKILAERTSCPFNAWIVGGDEGDLCQVAPWLSREPVLTRLAEEGRLMFWGRVEPECLPELFSRSAVTVMPSRYEPFGIVGLEAMACGSPLVASNVNGLAYVMLPPYTSRAVPPGDAEALAWALAGFLRRRGQRSIFARNAPIWASAFSMTEVAKRFRSLYAGEMPPPHPIETPQEFARDHIGGGRWHPPGDAAVLTVQHRHHTVVHIEQGGQRLVHKVLDTYPVADASLFDLPPDLSIPDDRVHLNRILFHRGRPWAVPVQAVQWDPPGVTFPALPLAGAAPQDLAVHLPFLEEMRRTCRPPDHHRAAMAAGWRVLRSRPGRDALAAFDRTGAAMQEQIFGRADIFQRVHPGAELIRIELHVVEGSWPLDATAREAFLAPCRRILAELPEELPAPGLVHGDFRARHVLAHGGRPVFCDWEESRFAVGAVDEASWLTGDILLGERSLCVAEAAALGSRLALMPDLHATMIAWTVCDLIYRALWSAFCGERGRIPTYAALAQEVVQSFKS